MCSTCDACGFIRFVSDLKPFNTAIDGEDLRQLVVTFVAAYDSQGDVQPPWSDDEHHFRELLQRYDYQDFDWGVIWVAALAVDVEQRKASSYGAVDIEGLLSRD